MAVITPFTFIMSLLPALIVTLLYTLLFGDKRNQYIEAFIAILYINAIGFTLLNVFLSDPVVPSNYDSQPKSGELFWVLALDFLFQFANALQTYFIWIMVSFMAVLFGQLVIMIKLALQDPLKMKFSNLIKRIVRKEPVSDGYSGLRDRLDNIKFEGIEPQPLDPEVVKKAWRESWRDYLLIGLVTIIPSISLYLSPLYDPLFDPYAYGILIFAIWIYRFGYPASNRIAKGAGITLGNRNLGSEMMRGVLGWFFRLNLLLSIGTIGFDVVRSYVNGTLNLMVRDYSLGLALAAVPILYAIVMLPLVEDFSVVLYKKVFESITGVRRNLSEFSMIGFIKNIAASGFTSLIVIGLFVGTVAGVCLNYAVNQMGSILFFPGQVDGHVFNRIVNGSSISQFIPPATWAVLMLLIPLGMMIFLGVFGSYIKEMVGGKNEGFAFFSGVFVSTAIWFILPGMDYLVNLFVTPVGSGVTLFYWLRPFMLVPSPDQLLFRIISQFVINLPLYVSVVLFILYYFHFKESWEEEVGIESSPLVNVKKQDVMDVVVLFAAGILGSALGVIILSAFVNPGDLYWLMYSLIAEIGNPDGLELVLAENVSFFMIVAEHNIIRTFLMLVAGPLFWMVILWMVAAQKKSKSDKFIGYTALLLVLVVGAASIFWTMSDLAAGVFIPATDVFSPTWPWTFVAQLGLRAGILYGILFGVYLLIFLLNHYGRGNSGGWWLPPILVFFALEYFVYDDQFTIIAIVILPMILAGFSKLGLGKKDTPTSPSTSDDEVDATGLTEQKEEDFILVYIRYALMSLAIAEILSTALWVAGLGTAEAILGGNALLYVIGLLPHGIVEIPTFLFAGAASIRIARDLGQYVTNEEWDAFVEKSKSLLTDRQIWRTFAFIMFFLLIAALIEEHITGIVVFIFSVFP